MGLDKSIFLEPFAASSFECSICLDISHPPLSFPCSESHVYCKECIAPLSSCALCREQKGEKEASTLSGQCRRIYSSLIIKCPKYCEWKAALGNLEKHLEQCPEQVIKCNYSDCSFEFVRKEMPSHSSNCMHRPINCGFCQGRSTPYQLMDHYNACGNYPMKCPEGNNQQPPCPSIPRSQVNSHLIMECPYVFISCSWSKFGCNHTCLRKDFILHESDPAANRHHLDLVNSAFAALSTSTSKPKSSHPPRNSTTLVHPSYQRSRSSSSFLNVQAQPTSPNTVSSSSSSTPLSSSFMTNTVLDDELIIACQEGSLRKVQHFLNQGAKVDAKAPPRNPFAFSSPLYIASAKGFEDIVRVLLQHGAPVNIQNHNGCTPLHAATQRGFTGVMIRLLAHGADPNIRANEGLKEMTPLHVACNCSSAEPLRILLNHGASINITTLEGETPAEIAAKSVSAGAHDILRELQRNTFVLRQ